MEAPQFLSLNIELFRHFDFGEAWRIKLECEQNFYRLGKFSIAFGRQTSILSYPLEFA